MFQHFFHPAKIKRNVVIYMIGIRLTGAGGVGSALFSVNDGFVHVVPLHVWL